jgi:broad specificity phosphatase PhoE
MSRDRSAERAPVEPALRAFIVRHGETDWNIEGRRQGSSDIRLSDTGIAQARAVAMRLSAEPVVAIYCSDLARAKETAQLIGAYHAVPIEETSALREAGLGEWEGMTDAEIADAYGAEAMAAYRNQPLAYRPPGSESLASVAARMQGEMDRIADRWFDGTVVIVGHGGSLRALLCQAVGAPPGCMVGFRLDNGSISLIERRGARAWICYSNDTSHLVSMPRAEARGR